MQKINAYLEKHPKAARWVEKTETSIKDFAEKHPKAAQWIREGGLFIIVSNLISAFKWLILTFLPYAFKDLWAVDFGWPGVKAELFGQSFTWNIFGYEVVNGGTSEGGLGLFIAFMLAKVIGEVINFPIQRSFVFRSKRPVGPQIAWYSAAFCVITVAVNAVNSVWVGVMGAVVPAWLYNIGTIVLDGGISMVVFFVVNKIIFPEGEKKQE